MFVPCDRKLHVSGHVVDGQHKPISKATVEFYGVKKQTDEKGCFYFGGLLAATGFNVAVSKPGYKNYRAGKEFPVSEAPGVSVFYKDESGAVFHTYSSFARGLENFIGAYNWLDIVPKGRDESGLSYGMQWLRHHDRYEDASFVDPYVKVSTG